MKMISTSQFLSGYLRGFLLVLLVLQGIGIWAQGQAPMTDKFGISVSISGDHAIVGAHFHDNNSGDSGPACIFQLTGSSWGQLAKLATDHGALFYNFSWSMSISGDYVIVKKANKLNPYLHSYSS